MKLAILCVTLKQGAVACNGRIGDASLRERMANEIIAQARISAEKYPEHEVQLMFNEDSGEQTTGAKRNLLVELAAKWGADAHAFIDDDDMPGETYVDRGIKFMESGCDVAELWGQIYFNGVPGNPFHHSIEHKEWWQDDKFYYRMPNHLNFVRTQLVKDIKFPDQIFGEDGKQSEAMRDAGVLKVQYAIPEILYHYYNGNPKHKI